jgi:NADPH:quinone reductase-like Zn-dependent oxidoreductase
MKAVRIHEYGGPKVLQYEDAPPPKQPVADELLVAVRAVAVNPLDWKLRAGLLKDYRPRRLPFIPGWDVSGIVEAVGAGVTAFKKGTEIYASPDTRARRRVRRACHRQGIRGRAEASVD